jgi:protein MpaA
VHPAAARTPRFVEPANDSGADQWLGSLAANSPRELVWRMVGSMQRLGLNKSGYAGETIEIQAILQRVVQAAKQHGWTLETLSADTDLVQPVLRRGFGPTRHKLYFSTGIHGDEPAGPLAMLHLVEENHWPPDSSMWVCPCLNPSGFPLNRRENAQGLDLNRDYRHLRSSEIRAHVAWLKQQPQFDMTFCLHEDWESHGFYLYELNPDHLPSLGEAIVDAVNQVCPIDNSPVIEGRPASHGIIRPDLDPAERPQWPEAFYLIQNQTRQSYTLEAPSDFALPTRVAALVAAVRAACDWLQTRSQT